MIVIHQNAIVTLKVENDKKIMHVLDNDQEGTRSLTNTVNSQYVEDLLEIWFVEPTDPEPYTVLLYGTDGVVAEWSKYRRFKHVPLDSQLILDEFLPIMENRRDCYV